MKDRAQPFLGVLMLDTCFPRPPGDVGNPETYARAGIHARFHRVVGASPRRIVEEADPALLEPFLEAARHLSDEGAALITTSCGFLAAFQSAMAASVPVPVVTSSLLQTAGLPRPGIITFDSDALSARILSAAGVPAGTPVMGVRRGSEFHSRILNNESTLNLLQAERDVVETALALIRANPRVESIVMECTNMPPYREAVEFATGRKVFDIETLLLQRWRSAC